MAASPAVEAEGARASRYTDAERIITDLAAKQHGVVARYQLLSAGVSEDAVDRRVRTRRLERVYRGVYCVGPLRSRFVAEMAAVLACGETAVLSHWSAAGLSQLPFGARTDRIEVSITRGHPARHSGLLVHRVRTLLADEVTKREGIPVTTVARTLYDLARRYGGHDLERACAQAISRGLVTREELLTVLERHRGARRLRALVEGGSQVSLTRSRAEDLFLSLVRKAQLPQPRVNDSVDGYVVDFFWPAERFAVEIDGYAHHASATMFESDRRRDAVLAATGIHVIRVTWRQLKDEPEALLVRLGLALEHCRRE